MTDVTTLAERIHEALAFALEGRAVSCVRPLQIGWGELLPVVQREGRSLGVVVDTVVEQRGLGITFRILMHLSLTRILPSQRRVLLLDVESVKRVRALSNLLPPSHITLSVEPDPRRVQCELLQSINRFRQKHSLGPLRESRELVRAAEVHCLDLAGRDGLSHTGADGSSPLNRAFLQACRFRAVYETTVQGCSNAQAIVGHWAASKTHRAILLTPDLHEVGISLLRANVLRDPILVAVYGGGLRRQNIRRAYSHFLRLSGLC